MIKKLLFFLLFSSIGNAQVVINELDADTPSTDVLEFIELKSSAPNFSLNGYSLVFFNALTAGTGTLSYYAIDLDGFTTDLNGIFLIGNTAVSPAPTANFPSSTIQNGPDVIALYQANASDFPLNTPATATNFINGIAYSNNATVTATSIMSILGITISTNENQTSNAPTQSIQRKNDGTYEVKTPTPGANNDGSGTAQNAISVLVTPTGNLTEGNAFSITFNTQTPVTTSPLVFTYSVANVDFNTFDYTGNLSVIIPVGSTSLVKNFTLTDDVLDEGDETMKITINTLPTGYIATANNILVRIHDNDFVVKPWGTPTSPTYQTVTNTKPVGYYNSLEGLTGSALKQAIQDIIANPAVVREHNYGDAYDILKEADQNPANSSQVWLMYVETPRSKLDLQTGTTGALGFWNREHIYPQSRGGFSDATSSTADGIGIWESTNANKIASGHSDMHHIRAEDSPENSSRSNRNYGVDYNGPTGSGNSWKGDVARAVFYMAIRYNGLNVVNGNVSETPSGNIGDLATLLSWNTLDPSDDFEMNRNNVIYNWQANRNPFIDHPDLANHIWGNLVGTPWSATLSNQSFDKLKVTMYPNPANDYITISGLNQEAKIEIYSLTGIKVYESKCSNQERINLNLSSGIYLVKTIEANKSATQKLIIR